MNSKLTIQTDSIPLFLYFSQLVLTAGLSIFIPDGISRRIIITVILLGSMLFLSWKKVHLDCYVVILFVCLTFAISLYNHPEYSELYNDLVFRRIISVSGGAFGYIMIRQYSSPEQIKKCLKAASIVLFIYFSYRMLLFLGSGSDESMDDAYGILIAAVSSLMWFFEERKKLWGFVGIVGAIEVLIFGTRGAVLCVLIFLLMYIITVIVPKQKSTSRIVSLIFIMIGAIILYFSYEGILLFLATKFSNINVISRISNQIISGTLSDTNGRDIIWDNVIALINDGSFWGHGALADQYNINYFSHNIFLEVLLTYGKFFGGILIILLIALIVSMFIGCKDENYRQLFLIFFCCSIPRLAVSNSFWYDQSFWMMLGLSVTYLKTIRDRTTEVELSDEIYYSEF